MDLRADGTGSWVPVMEMDGRAEGGVDGGDGEIEDGEQEKEEEVAFMSRKDGHEYDATVVKHSVTSNEVGKKEVII